MPDTEKNIVVALSEEKKSEAEKILFKKIDKIDEIRSDEVQEILSHIPNWMIRWGITLIFGLIMMLVFMTWFIRYPDIIKGEAIITTDNPPIKVVSRAEGKLIKFFKHDNEDIKLGDNIALIENETSLEAVEYLEELDKKLQVALDSDQSGNIVFNDSDFVFGPAQQSYNALKNTWLDFYYYKEQNFIETKINSIMQKIKFHNDLSKIAKNQIFIARNELNNAAKKFETDKKLYKNGTISKNTFFKNESEYRQSQQTLEGYKKSYKQNQLTISNLEQEILVLENDDYETRRNFQEDIHLKLNEIQNFIGNWKQNFLITSPLTGRLTFLENLKTNQYITSNSELFAIIPQNDSYIAYTYVTSAGYGKVKTGQDVRIKVLNFPYEQYGQLQGKVKTISPLMTNEKYRVEIILDNGLETTYHLQLKFSPEMTGEAEIVTDKLKLFDRIFNQFRKLMDR